MCQSKIGFLFIIMVNPIYTCLQEFPSELIVTFITYSDPLSQTEYRQIRKKVASNFFKTHTNTFQQEFCMDSYDYFDLTFLYNHIVHKKYHHSLIHPFLLTNKYLSNITREFYSKRNSKIPLPFNNNMYEAVTFFIVAMQFKLLPCRNIDANQKNIKEEYEYCVFDMIRLTNYIDLARIEVKTEIKNKHQDDSNAITIKLREIVPLSPTYQTNRKFFFNKRNTVFKALFAHTTPLILFFESIMFDVNYSISAMEADSEDNFKINTCDYFQIKTLPLNLFIKLCFLRKFENANIENPLINCFNYFIV